MTKSRILFINSQQDNSEFMENITCKLQDEWEFKIIGSGAEALKALKEVSYDVVVSEMSLQDMEGCQLLQRVSEVKPGTIRFILSANIDKEAIILTTGCVHQYISTPCDPEDFKKLLSNSIGLRKILSNPELHARIANIKSLPSPPEIYNQLMTELQSEDTSVFKVANIIKKDVSITAKLLQLANSSYFGLRSHVENPLNAINLLGLDNVKNLVLAVGVFNQFDDPKLPEFSFNDIYNRSITVGTSSRTYATILGLSHQMADDALIAGMLHNIGKLIMITNFQSELRECIRQSKEKSISIYQAEKEMLGVTDAEIGAHLLSLWGLPDSILEAVVLHYLPHKAPSILMNVLTTVHLAYAVEHDQRRKIKDESASALDMEYLSKLNLKNQLASLQGLAMATVC